MKHIALLFILVVLSQPFHAQKGIYRLLIGTYTNTGKSQGIYSYEVDRNASVFNQKTVATDVSNPSYLAITQDKKYVYSVNESKDGSAANAFSFDDKAAGFTLLNRSLTEGSGPCYILTSDKHVFTANYGGGSISVFGRNPDGSLTGLQQKVQHTGSSINKERQSKPHVHQVILSPDKKYVVANDLGTDLVTVYAYHPESKTEILVLWDTLSVKPGSGPRHATFSKDGKKLYLLQELDGSLSVINMNNGKLSLVQEMSVIGKNKIKAWAADIHFSPDYKFLYATNRAPANNITCFSVAEDGKLKCINQVSTGGDGPRNFAFTPDGEYLFVAHQFSDNVVVFKRDPKTGFLTNTGKQIKVGAPVCLLFY
ncbi:MAG: lactonase family protein [Bacteroidales bacterium]|nr:lactonase family protein [Bacteroidales bacterium]